MIEFHDVSKSFGAAEPAVTQLDLTIRDGELTVFVGPSGCGKTTTLRMINRMVEPSSGKVLVNGEDIGEVDPALLRRGIGYVIQQAGLFPHRTVVDNVATVPLLYGRRRAEARSRAMELMELVGLDLGLARRYPAQLSGGQQQRVGVARALAADPPILLMDEPFSAVDPVVRADLQRQLLELQRELDKTIVFVTHDIDEAVRIGERIAVFRTGGRLAQYATPVDLLTNPADDFVAGFVGRDRGYRRLSFMDGGRLPLTEVERVHVGEPVAAGPRWRLAVDEQERPRGWLPPEVGADSGLDSSSLRAGGSLAEEGGAIRAALDAALSSPAGLGVVIDTDGRYVGVITAQRVLDVINAQRDPESDAADGESRWLTN